MNRNVDKYMRSLPWLGIIISVALLILYFVIVRVKEDLFIVFLYCLVPIFVNTSMYILYLIVTRKSK
ncbi:hypothetical protein LN051_11385 (plasmid) [Staphylococcus ratti]|uniref:Doubtful CDS n=1 Tax=Staphylococcus ratti TaxID=2892440 RepID=A0ABY3PFY4_9STAP|nr:hypothetical protein [Staphylococcus ratti]UEX91210.1 hypothetical protein LN051_11385 [Staphylococcus ratti]